MASKRNRHEEQASKARLQMFEAKQELEVVKVVRRSRDNRLALLASGIAVVVVIALQFTYFSFGPGASTSKPTPSETLALPAASLAGNQTWNANIWMNAKRLQVELYGALAPQSTSNFIYLADKHFFDGILCHRLTTKGVYILQCGDPNGDGTGGPGYQFGPIENAPKQETVTQDGKPMTAGLYKAGTIAMARQGNNAASQGSQFFIVYKDSYFSNDTAGGYSVFGKITSGLATLAPEVKKGVAKGATDGKPVGRFMISSIDINKPKTSAPSASATSGAK